MSSILDQIVEQTAVDLKRRKSRVSRHDLTSYACYEVDRRGFRQALRGDGVSVIAEIKRASPSRGVIRRDFDPVAIAESYAGAGATALSVLTDTPFFQGELSYLEKISMKVNIPLLRKDFIIDPYQIREARAYGADAVLLIVAISESNLLDELLHAAEEEELDALVECYSEEEVDRIDWDRVSLFGVNNRDLNTFQVDLHRGVELLRRSPHSVVRVSESGLATASDLRYLEDREIDAALIGEHLMKQKDPGVALGKLLEEVNTADGSKRKQKRADG